MEPTTTGYSRFMIVPGSERKMIKTSFSSSSALCDAAFVEMFVPHYLISPNHCILVSSKYPLTGLIEAPVFHLLIQLSTLRRL